MTYDKEVGAIPRNAGLHDYQRLLAAAENQIRRITPIMTQYRINRANTRSTYDDALSDAKINAINTYGLKPAHQTLINAYANADPEVKRLKKEWMDAKALETKAIDRLSQLQGQRDTLKAMVKSENPSY